MKAISKILVFFMLLTFLAGYLAIEGIQNVFALEELSNFSDDLSVSSALKFFSDQENINISGVVTLPDHEIAPEGGVTIYIVPRGVSEEDWQIYGKYYDEYSKKVTVPEWSNSNWFSLSIPKDLPEGRIALEYYVLTDYVPYVDHYYMDSNNPKEIYLHDLTKGDLIDISIELVKGNVISGFINLPEAFVAPKEGLKIEVNAFMNNNNKMERNYYKDFTIASGESSLYYFIPVLPIDSLEECIVEFRVASQGTRFIGGYYSDTGLCTDWLEADNIKDIANGSLMLKSVELFTGSLIGGTIALPQGKTAPVGGLEICIYVSNNYTYLHSYVNIPEGESSIYYTVPVFPNNSYKIEYFVENKDSGFLGGYYTAEKLTTNGMESQWVGVASEDILEIHAVLIESRKIKGTIFLPNGELAPAGGLDVELDVESDNGGWFFTEVHIPEGQNSAEYILHVDDVNREYKIRYFVEEPDYIYGYYGGKNTVYDDFEAEWVMVDRDEVTGINITLLRGQSIMGRISLPSHAVAPVGGIELCLEAEAYNGYCRKTVIIPEGSNYVDYKLTVRPSIYKIFYTVESFATEYLDGYYGKNGTVYYDIDATEIDVENQNASGINIELLKGNIISGQITLPNGEMALNGDLVIGVIAETEFGEDYRESAFILQGQGSTSYAIAVPADGYETTYKIRFVVWHGESPYVETYYSSSGSVYDQEDASSISVNGVNVEGIDVVLLKGLMVSGKVAFPEEMLAPSEGVSLWIEAQAVYHDGSTEYLDGTTVYIPRQQNSTNYNLYIHPRYRELPFIVYCQVNDHIAGYYHPMGLRKDISQASPLVFTSDDSIANIDLVIDYLKDSNITVETTVVTANGLPVQELIPSQTLVIESTVTNNGFAEQAAVMVVALYDQQGKLENLKYVPEKVQPGCIEKLETELKLPNNVTGYSLKVMLWDRLTSMKPLGDQGEGFLILSNK